MSEAIVFSNARMVLPGEVVRGSLSVAEGRIAALDGGSTAAGIVDLENDYLLPGLVEVHTDNFERHLMPRPKVQWAEMPALLAHDAEVAAAGITTVFDALGVGESDTESLRGSTWTKTLATLDNCAAKDLLRADHHLHVRCELPAPNTIELFEPFHGHPRVSLISLMDHTPGQRQWENIEVARIYYTGKKGWSAEKFERQVAHAATLQAQYAAPHRRHSWTTAAPTASRSRAMTTPPWPTSSRRMPRARACRSFRPRWRLPRPRANAGWPPSWAGRTWCVAARIRATSRRPSWRAKGCWTSSRPTTCRAACSAP